MSCENRCRKGRKSKKLLVSRRVRSASINKEHTLSIKPLSTENVAIELNKNDEQLYENTTFIGMYTYTPWSGGLHCEDMLHV